MSEASFNSSNSEYSKRLTFRRFVTNTYPAMAQYFYSSGMFLDLRKATGVERVLWLATGRRPMKTMLVALALIVTIPLCATAADIEVDGFKLGSAYKNPPRAGYTCAPLLSDALCKKSQPGTIFGAPARKVEMTYKNNRLTSIVVGFALGDTPQVGKALETQYGLATNARVNAKGVSQAIWVFGDTQIRLIRDEGRRETSVQMSEKGAPAPQTGADAV